MRPLTDTTSGWRIGAALVTVLCALFAARRFASWPDGNSETLRLRWLRQCRTDCLTYADCLAGDRCDALGDGLRIPLSWMSWLDLLDINRRSVQMALWQGAPAFVKRRSKIGATQTSLEAVCTEGLTDVRDRLLKLFIESDRQLEPFQIRPLASLHRFVQAFGGYDGNDAILPEFMLHINVEALLMCTLQPLGFPVSQLLHQAGLVVVYASAGRPLTEFYARPLNERSRIARNLLRAALRFTDGLHGFRIYLTDATADNIVVNAANGAVFFVDLDSVIVVDGQAIVGDVVHRYEPIPCEGCFAFDAEELGIYGRSDFNVYAICSLLAFDLYGDRSNGFLHSAPPLLAHAIEECVSGSGDRFISAQNLINMLDDTFR